MRRAVVTLADDTPEHMTKRQQLEHLPQLQGIPLRRRHVLQFRPYGFDPDK